MLERLSIPMWVSSNQKMIFLLVLSQWLPEAENHFLFISFWTSTNSLSVDSKICLWKKLLVQDTASVYNELKISYLKHNTFPSFLSMVLLGDSQALLTSIAINFHPVESGLLWNSLNLILQLDFLASASLHNHCLTSQMLSHFDKWMLKTTLPSSDFVERWHKERRNVFCIHYEVLRSERRIKLATLRAIKIWWSLLLPAAPGASASPAQSCRSWDLAAERSPPPGISFWGFHRQEKQRTCSSDQDLPLFKEKSGNLAALQRSALEFAVIWGRICFSCWGLWV